MIAHSSKRHARDDSIENDDVFDALADEQRRQLLVGLQDSDPQHVAALSDAARELAGAHEAFLDQVLSGEVAPPGVDMDLIQKHYLHLPKLAEYEFIEWHPEDRLVTKGPRFDELQPVLDLIENDRMDRPASGHFISPSE